MVMEPTEPYWWVYGLKQDSRGKEVWYPLYCYDSAFRARRIFNLIFDLDDLPDEIADFEDFKLEQEPDDNLNSQKSVRAISKKPEAKVKKPAKGKIIKKKAIR